MWTDYNAAYRDALSDGTFLAWREAGARQKAINIVEVCRKIPVSSALEIGCGTGSVLRALGSLQFANRYVATDISAAAVEFAKHSCGPLLNEAYVGSADSLPFPDKSFSVAILSHVIEHLENPICAVRDAARVADYVVIEVQTERVLSNTIRAQILGKPFLSAAEAGHVQFWSSRSITSFLEQDCGQEILSRHRDLLSREVEFHGRKSARKIKPLIKEALKSVIPDWLYAQLLTTHATFLCREFTRGEKKLGVAPNSSGKEAH
jgi:ubiquinone/menaquinone biosynthesis C-methylase UbiE